MQPAPPPRMSGGMIPPDGCGVITTCGVGVSRDIGAVRFGGNGLGKVSSSCTGGLPISASVTLALSGMLEMPPAILVRRGREELALIIVAAASSISLRSSCVD